MDKKQSPSNRLIAVEWINWNMDTIELINLSGNLQLLF